MHGVTVKFKKYVILLRYNYYTKIDFLEYSEIWSVLKIKANDMHYFSNLFDTVLYMYRRSPLSIIRSISTVYTRSRYMSC